MKIVTIPDATDLTPQDWYDLLLDVAKTYDLHFLTAEEIAAGNIMATSEDLRAFAPYIRDVLQKIVLSDSSK